MPVAKTISQSAIFSESRANKGACKMRKGPFILLLILLTVIVSCNSPEIDPEPTQVAPTTEIQSESTVPAVMTVLPAPTETPLPENYPAPTPIPTYTPNPDYPALPTLTPKYPAGESNVRVWMLRPLGIQCSEPNDYLYATLEEAVDALEAAGVEVIDAEMVSLPVTESCDSPTSEHFRALINASGLDTAVSLDWIPE
jgi:hypothetical protein